LNLHHPQNRKLLQTLSRELRNGNESAASLHKNCANRIIALKFAELPGQPVSFPQGFPLFCAKLYRREIFFLARKFASCQKSASVTLVTDFDRSNSLVVQ